MVPAKPLSQTRADRKQRGLTPNCALQREGAMQRVFSRFDIKDEASDIRARYLASPSSREHAHAR